MPFDEYMKGHLSSVFVKVQSVPPILKLSGFLVSISLNARLSKIEMELALIRKT